MSPLVKTSLHLRKLGLKRDVVLKWRYIQTFRLRDVLVKNSSVEIFLSIFFSTERTDRILDNQAYQIQRSYIWVPKTGFQRKRLLIFLMYAN